MSLARYLEWRIAADRFGRRPWQLTAEETAQVDAQAARERHVITQALAAEEAADMPADPAVVDAAVAQLAKDFPDRSAFVADLLRGGLTEATLADAIAAELRAGQILDRIGAAAVIDESQVRAYYDRHRPRMVVPERRAARHILITVNDTYAENTRERAQQRLQEAADALNGGADFEQTAMRYSECPSALEGGKLGEVRRGQLYPELDAVLFVLQAGEVRVVESPLGFHLLRCDAVIPPQPVTYEAAAASIRRKLETTAKERLLRNWLAESGSHLSSKEG